MDEDWKVFIRGNKDRGEEVIKMLENLGGKTNSLYDTNEDSLYFINHNRIIDGVYLSSEMAKIIMDNYSEIKLPEKWKDGDILINNDESCYKVFSEYGTGTDVITTFFAYNMSISVNGTITDYKVGVWVCDIKDYRLATPSEVEHFYKLLHASNKDWDAEKKEIVDWKWKPKKNEKYWFISFSGNIIEYIWTDSPDDKTCFNFGNCFHTREEAKAMAEKINKLLKGKS